MNNPCQDCGHAAIGHQSGVGAFTGWCSDDTCDCELYRGDARARVRVMEWTDLRPGDMGRWTVDVDDYERLGLADTHGVPFASEAEAVAFAGMTAYLLGVEASDAILVDGAEPAPLPA